MNPEKPFKSEGSPQEKTIREFFPDRQTFHDNVKAALEWRDRGGPEVGTSAFLKAIYNENAEGKLSPRDYGRLQAAIKKEVKKMRKEEENKNSDTSTDPDTKTDSNTEVDSDTKTDVPLTDKETDYMINDSRKQQWRERKRSGGVNPNEI